LEANIKLLLIACYCTVSGFLGVRNGVPIGPQVTAEIDFFSPAPFHISDGKYRLLHLSVFILISFEIYLGCFTLALHIPSRLP
jgi:hypothetical protein